MDAKVRVDWLLSIRLFYIHTYQYILLMRLTLVIPLARNTILRTRTGFVNKQFAHDQLLSNINN